MERHEFIQKIIELYPDTFKEERISHVQAWVEMYERALPKSWNFDKLMWYFATEYKSTVAPPPPSFFFNYRNEVKPEEKRVQKKVIDPIEQEACERAHKKYLMMTKNLAMAKGLKFN